MIIIVDGYNVLKGMLPGGEISERQRREFLTILGRYVQRKKHKLIVVFDGGPYEWAHQESISHLRVFYSGRHQTADEWIMHYLEDHKTKELLLVSSDHELGLFASRLDIPSIASDDFYMVVRDTLLGQAHISDEGGDMVIVSDTEDLDTLMDEASQVIPIKDEDVQRRRRQRPAQRASKLERKLYQKIKKL